MKRYVCLYHILFTLALLCYTIGSYAQRHPFYNLNVENGLIQSQVRALAQDRYGFLWIGTLGGLSRYDGQTFTNYTVRDGLLNNTVSALATDEAGNIWIGTVEGLSAYNGRDFTHYKFSDHNPEAVTDIKITERGNVWCVANGRLYQIVDQKSKLTTTPSENISAMLPNGNDIWIAAEGTIYKYHNKHWDTLNYPNNIKPVTFTIYKDSWQNIWLGTNAGLFRVKDSIITQFTRNGRPLQLPPVVCITEDKKGNLWLGINSGALRLKDSTLSYFNKQNGLSDNIFYDALTDAEGNVWLASDGQGVFRYSGMLFTLLDEESGLPSGQVTSIAGDKYGRLFFGTYDAGVNIYSKGSFYPVRFPNNATPAITSMAVTRGERVWVGTLGNGLWLFNGISFRQYAAPSATISALYADTSGRLWVGTANGAGYYEDETFYSVNTGNTLIQDFMPIGIDSMLIASNNGIKIYKNNNVFDFKTGTVADSVTPQCFALLNNKLWIGSSDNGIVVYDLQTRKANVINKTDGLRSEFIYNIIAGDDGSIWAGTGYGIHRIRLVNGQPSISFYGKEQGLKGMESNHNAVYKMQDGSIWFGTTNGAVHYRPGSQMIQPKPLSVVMQSVEVFGERIRDTSYYDSTDVWNNVPYRLKLPYRKNNITFTFQGVTLGGSQQLLYRYRIQGLDAPWSDWSRVNTVTYSALPPGNYIFHVQCKTGADTTAIQELNYPFHIITPFHKTAWFRLLILGGCILLGVSIQYIVNRRKQNRQALLERLRKEEQAKVRQRTAEDFHDELGNKLTRINVLTNVLKNKLGKTDDDKQRILEQIQDNTKQLYGGTRDILWSLQPANDNLYEIINRIRQFGEELFSDTEIIFVFSGNDERFRQYRLPMDKSRNLIMIFKEAFNNALKYSQATTISLEATMKGTDAVQIKLRDDGKGFDVHYVKRGHGIDNMNVRAGRLGGRLYIDSEKDKGTILTLTFKLPSKRG